MCFVVYLYTVIRKLRLLTAMPSISDGGSDIATLHVCLPVGAVTWGCPGRCSANSMGAPLQGLIPTSPTRPLYHSSQTVF